MQHRLGSSICFVALLLIAGCGKAHRPRDDVFAEKMRLPQLYIGLKTNKRIEAPMSKGVFVDEETQDEFWPAMECTNPNCPDRKPGQPALFVLPRTETRRGCPACLKIRDPQNESPAQKAKFEESVVPHVLPATKARMQQLDEELAQGARR